MLFGKFVNQTSFITGLRNLMMLHFTNYGNEFFPYFMISVNYFIIYFVC